MPKITQSEIRENAQRFVHEWRDESAERAEAQTFWNDFFKVFGIERRKVAAFEKAVQKLGGGYGRIDVFWSGVLLVEHKSRGESLSKAALQGFDYIPNLDDNDIPQYVLVSDFARFRLYDLDNDTQIDFGLEDLPNQINLFGFISGWERRSYEDQDPINIAVANQLAELHNALRDNGYGGHDLEIFLIRLVYCLFADDTGIFPRDQFRFFLEERTNENGSDTGAMLDFLFTEILNRSVPDRQRTLDEDLQQFDYINGNLFAERIATPVFNREMRTILLGACRYDWSKVSPAIFGSLFQHVMNDEERRAIGAHYTSEKNILKLVSGLFLDQLKAEFEVHRFSIPRLQEFRSRLSRMRFFDPACGCGNFLVITYREMRLLELEVLRQIRQLQGHEAQEILFDSATFSLIDVDNFYGIEIEEFPAQIAQVALWITDHLMNERFSLEFGQPFRRLPLTHTPNIINDNALRLDWKRIFNFEHADPNIELLVLGNPPFIGKDKRTAEQTADMDYACRDIQNSRTLDFVAAWYVKAAEFIRDTRIKAAFVSTNSITQGEQVSILWQPLLEQGIKIHFAHRTFKWRNEARGVAAVHCVIIGFGAFDVQNKHLFDYETPTSDPHEIAARNINPYLIDYDDLVVTSRRTPICDVPEMIYGNKPVDGGNLFFNSTTELNEFLAKEPNAERFVRSIYGSEEFINGIDRWCLWLADAAPSEINVLPEVMRRVQAVRDFRLKSTKEATRKLASVPYLFAEIRQPDSDFLIVPLTSSENRRYIPIGFMTRDICVNNLVSIVPNATLFHFGVLTSQMHMAWMRQVCGRLESRYRYSNNLVYNNFPFPQDVSDRLRERVEQAAQNVLDVRAEFPNETLADLYNPDSMPIDLVRAHSNLDGAVDTCYGRRRFNTDLERLAFLFELYRQYTEPLNRIAEIETRRVARRRR